MSYLVLPYKAGSESSKLLSTGLNCKRMRVENSSVRDRDDLTIVNWGNSTMDVSLLPSVKIINHPSKVKLASHKIKFFETIEQDNEDSFVPINIPAWTTDVDEAKRWYSEGNDIVVRNVLQGHSGDGIELVQYKEDVTPSSAIPRAPLYTKYMKKRDEFRVHVMSGVPILVQRKANKYGVKPSNYQIRNHDNGFVYTISDVDPDESVISHAVNAVTVLGLDFGAVDVIWNQRKKEATVLEVNTACGLAGDTTLARYVESFRSLFNGEKITNWKDAIITSRMRVPGERFGQSLSASALRLKIGLDMLANNGDDIPELHCEDPVVTSMQLHALFTEYESSGGDSRGIVRYLEDYHIGGGGRLYIEDVNDDGTWCRLGFADDDGDYDIIPFHIPTVQLEYSHDD